MFKIEQIILDENGRNQHNLVINAKRGDTCRGVNIHIRNNGQFVELYNNRSKFVKIEFSCRKPNHTHTRRELPNSVICSSANGGYIPVVFTREELAVAGTNYAEISLTTADGVVTTGSFVIQVFPLAIDSSTLYDDSKVKDLQKDIDRLLSFSAKDIPYDNTESGLESSNVQDAYDELSTKIEDLNTKYEQVFQEVDEKRLELIKVLARKNVTIPSTATLKSIPSYMSQIKGTNPNIYCQLETPSGTQGIWIQEELTSFRIFATEEMPTEPVGDPAEPYVILVSGNKYSTKLFDSSPFPTLFQTVLLQKNGAVYVCPYYYGNGTSWTAGD